MMGINLDEAAIARREENKISPSLIYKGETYELPVELPADTVEAMSRMSAASKAKDGVAVTHELKAAIATLLGDRADAFFAKLPSVQDLSAVIAGIPEEYGLTSGESSDSDSA